jgi:hypothetical protein
MTTDTAAWIHDLAGSLPIQAELLDRLVRAIAPDERWEWLELGCSVPAGRGDVWSDLDLGLGYTGDVEPALDGVTTLLRSLAEVVDLSVQPWDGHPRWWVQYRNGAQIDLLMMPADLRSGRAPGSVALLDRAGRLARPFIPQSWTASHRDPTDWLLDGWEALANVAKHLHRGSPLEAIEQLHRARSRVLALHAVGEGVPYPRFGLTSLLDVPTAGLPADLPASYPTARADDVARAAMVTARLLEQAAGHAEAGLDTPLRPYVLARLATVTDPPNPEPELLAAVQRRAEALGSGRAEELAAVLHPDFHWTSHRGEVFDRDRYAQQIEDPQCDVVGAVGVVRCLVLDEVERDGVRLTFRMPVTQTWVRDEAGVWTCLAGHAGPTVDR